MIKRVLIWDVIILFVVTLTLTIIKYNYLDDYSISGEDKGSLFKGETDNLLNLLDEESFNIKTYGNYSRKTIYVNDTISISCGEYDWESLKRDLMYCVLYNYNNEEYISKDYSLYSGNLINIHRNDEDSFLIIQDHQILKIKIGDLSIIKRLEWPLEEESTKDSFKTNDGVALLTSNGILVSLNKDLLKQKENAYEIDVSMNYYRFIYNEKKLCRINKRDTEEYKLRIKCADDQNNNVEREIKFKSDYTLHFSMIKFDHQGDILIFYIEHEKLKVNKDYHFAQIKLMRLNKETLETKSDQLITEIGIYHDVVYGVTLQGVILDDQDEMIIALTFSSDNHMSKRQGEGIRGKWRNALILLKMDDNHFIGSMILESNQYQDEKYEYAYSDGMLHEVNSDLYIAGEYKIVDDIYQCSIEQDICGPTYLHFFNIKIEQEWNDNFCIESDKIQDTIDQYNNYIKLGFILCGGLTLIIIFIDLLNKNKNRLS